MSFTEYFLEYGHNWTTNLLILLVIICVVIAQWKRFIRFSVSHMLMVAILLWISGFWLYVLGLTFEGSAQNIVTSLLRAAVSSIKMFVADNNFIEISEHYKDNPTYMLAFSVVHFLSVCMSAIFVLSALGRRFSSYIVLLKEMLECDRKARHSYVFWDVNTPSTALAKDIRKKDKDARIINLSTYTPEALGEKLEVTQIISAAAISLEADAEGMDEIDSIISVQIPRLSKSSNRMAWLRKILESSSEVDFFFLTPEPEVNLHIAENFARNYKLKIKNGSGIGIHVLTKSGARQIVAKEHLVLHEEEGTDVRWSFIDTPTLSVESLKYNVDNYPVNTFRKENISGGRVDGEFNAWLLGMGETGMEMFRYLYEFSMLEGMDSEVIRRNFVLFDKNIDRQSGNLIKDCPELGSAGTIDISDILPGTAGFWRKLQESADRINCVSIAMGDDELDLKYARDIFRQLQHFGSKRKVRTKIYVKVYSSIYLDAFHTLASEYNGAGPDREIEIIPFGGDADLFNTDIILQDSVLKAFKVFNHRFDMIRGKNEGMSPEECWKADLSISKFMSMYHDATISLDELKRREALCISGTFFTASLLKLSGTDRGDHERIDMLLGMLDSADGMTDSLVDVLVRTCYLRAMASHELLGFSPCSMEYVRDNRIAAMTQKKTPYLLPWKETSETTREMFKDILRTSLVVAKELYTA